MNSQVSSSSLVIKNLTLSYERHPAIHHANISFLGGSSTAILGPNGAGKSTFVKALAGLHPIDEGEIIRNNIPLKKTAYLSQSIGFEKDFPLEVLEVIKMGFFNSNFIFKRTQLNQTQSQLLEEALNWTQLHQLKKFPLRKLSLGQLQRVRWARMIVQNPELILMDEPFSGLDEMTIEHLATCLKHWSASKKTIIMILHDHKFAINHFSHLMYLDRTIQLFKSTDDLRSISHFNMEKLLEQERIKLDSEKIKPDAAEEVCSE